MKKNNKGFSLVELIIVIAIMAVLIGLLAPQYLRFVEKSKKSADVSNAQSLATAFNVAFADGKLTASDTPGGNGGDSYGSFGVQTWPEGKSVSANAAWAVTIGEDGVSKITLASMEIWPTPASAFQQ